MSLVSALLGRSRPRLSIERRIVAAALATAIAVLCAASAAFFAQQWRAEDGEARRAEALVAYSLTGQMGEPRTREEAARLLAGLKLTPSLSSARIEGANGQVLGSLVYRPLRAAAPPAPQALPLKNGGRIIVIGGGDAVSNLLPEFLSVCGALFFISTGVALFLGRALARRIVEPLDVLSAFMREVTGHAGPARRAPPSAFYEVSRLTDSFNDLLGRLQVNDAALRRSMEQLVEARDTAEAANLMKSQFLANMSHEIRTPLNGVLAMAEVISLGELEPVQRDRLRVVRESGEALLAILNDVLDVSKIEAGRMELEVTQFDAASTIRSACDVFAAAIQEKGLAFTLEIAPQATAWRLGDEVRLRQVLVNLLSNAVKFTAKGEVGVRVGGSGPDGLDGLEIEVRDTGVGFGDDQLPHLFDKFTQADSSVTRRFGGTGLGLAICRQLVELMGGGIEVQSRPGEGSTFRVTVAMPGVPGSAQAPAPLAPPPAAPAPAVGADRPLRVLAAEDNTTNQLVLSTIMGVFGVEVEIVGDGRQAVEAWAANDYDLILMDVQMPEMDGMSATRAIRAAEAQQGRRRTPIIALSANAMTHQVRDYLAAGMDDHVPKPIELARLQAALERASEPASGAEAA